MFSLSAIGQDCLKGHTDFNGMLGNAVPNGTIRKRLLTLEEIHINANIGNGVLVLHNSVRVDSFLREGAYRPSPRMVIKAERNSLLVCRPSIAAGVSAGNRLCVDVLRAHYSAPVPVFLEEYMGSKGIYSS